MFSVSILEDLEDGVIVDTNAGATEIRKVTLTPDNADTVLTFSMDIESSRDFGRKPRSAAGQS